MRGREEKKYYVTISEGKIREKSEEGNPEAEFRKVVTHDGSIYEKWEIVDDWIQGFIVKLSIQTHSEYGDRFMIHIKDGDRVDILQLRINSFLSVNLINKLACCDFSQQVKIIPYYFKNDDKQAIVIEQAGMKVPPMFSKDSPGKVPALDPEVSKTPKAQRTKAQKLSLEKWKLDFYAFYEAFFVEVLTPQVQQGYEENQVILKSINKEAEAIKSGPTPNMDPKEDLDADPPKEDDDPGNDLPF